MFGDDFKGGDIYHESLITSMSLSGKENKEQYSRLCN